MDREQVALSCLYCSFSKLVKTPDNQEALMTIIDGLKTCPECETNGIIQVAWRDSNGTIGSVQF